jgi:hypothetical protein
MHKYFCGFASIQLYRTTLAYLGFYLVLVVVEFWQERLFTIYFDERSSRAHGIETPTARRLASNMINLDLGANEPESCGWRDKICAAQRFEEMVAFEDQMYLWKWISSGSFMDMMGWAGAPVSSAVVFLFTLACAAFPIVIFNRIGFDPFD